MSSKRIITGYAISGDPEEVDSKEMVPEALREKLYSYYEMAQRGRQNDIHKLIKAIEKYPQVPQLKNYLSMLYSVLGNKEKAYKANFWMVKEHPDYLFGKINLANQYLDEKKYEEIPKILGESMELKSLYPERNVFHVQEFEAFYQISAMYFAAIGDMDQYQKRVDILKQVSPESPILKNVESFKLKISMEKAMERMKEEEPTRTRVKVKAQKITKTTEAPDFQHAVIRELYNYDLRIPINIIDKILELPRETLVEDLHRVIEDSIERYGHFRRTIEMGDEEEYPPEFPIHALFLLGELASEESLPVVLNMLSQSDEYLEFYFGDMVTEAIWEPLFRIANEQMDELKSFIEAPGVDTFAKAAVLDVLVQIGLHFPERVESLAAIFSQLVDFYLQDELPDDVFDKTVIAFITTSVMDLQLDALLPAIKKLYEMGRIDISVNGLWEDYMELWEEAPDYSYKREVLSIKDRYLKIVTTWAGYQDTADEPENPSMPDTSDLWGDEANTPVRNEGKVGRNDPCPCGSGKKYKKCCWGE